MARRPGSRAGRAARRRFKGTQGVEVVVTGMEDIRAGLDRLESAVEKKALVRAVDAGAKTIQREAARRAPIRTAHLARNIDRETKVSKRTEAVVAVGPNEDAYYGIFSELGTIYHPAHPWLRPAFDAKRAEAVHRVREDLRRSIRRKV